MEEKGCKLPNSTEAADQTADLSGSIHPNQKELAPKEDYHDKKHKHVVKLFDVIVEKIGYGTEQFSIILVAGLCFMCQGLYFSLNGSMMIPLKQYFNVDNSSISIASSIIYLSGIIISLMLGFLTHLVGRLRLIKITLIINVIFHAIMTLTTDFKMYCVCLAVIGACVNLNSPILLNILAEYLPVKYRAFTMGSIWGWYSLGNLFLLLVYLYIMPVYSPDKFIMVMHTFLILPFITMIVGFFYLSNSPRSLIIGGKENEGLDILSKMYSKTEDYQNQNHSEPDKEVFSVEEKERIIRELKHRRSMSEQDQHGTENLDEIEQNAEPEKEKYCSIDDAGFYDIFSQKFRLTSILLIFLWMLNSLVGYGPFFIVPLTLSEMQAENKVETEVSIIKSQLMIIAIGLVSNPLGGILCEVKSLGRVKTGVLAAVIGFAINMFLIFDFNNIVIYLGLLNICNTLVFNTTITYTSEVYPTYVRDYSSGLLNCLGNFGAMISQPLYIFYNFMGIKIPYMFTAGFFLLSSASFFFLPFETRGTELDYDEE